MKICKNKLIMIKDKDYETDTIKSCHDVYDFLKDKIELNKEPEEVVVMFALDNKKNIINFSELSRGTINNSLLYPREVFKRALISNAHAVIIAHNHPSGNCYPSIEDKQITGLLKEAGNIIGIQLLDHIIVGEKDYYSFFENDSELISEKEAKNFYKQYEEKRNKNIEGGRNNEC